MKIIIVISLLLTSMLASAQSVTLESKDIASLHEEGLEGMKRFIQQNGFLDKGQQQQQQNAQMSQCNIGRQYGKLWQYSEIMNIEEVIASGKLNSKRSKVQGLNYGQDDEFSRLIDKIHAQNNVQFRLSCTLTSFTWTFWEYGGHVTTGWKVDQVCLKSCTENQVGNCQQCSTPIIDSGVACEIPNYIGKEETVLNCVLKAE